MNDNPPQADETSTPDDAARARHAAMQKILEMEDAVLTVDACIQAAREKQAKLAHAESAILVLSPKGIDVLADVLSMIVGDIRYARFLEDEARQADPSCRIPDDPSQN